MTSPKCPKPSLVCPLTGPSVYPETPEGADILMVGMNPGAEEERLLRPFVGPSGRILRRWLREVGLLERAAFCNIELHRTPKNREPTFNEVRACRPVLLRTILYVDPKVIVCVGGSAAWEFGYKGSVGKMVGKYQQWKYPKACYPTTYLTTVVFHPGGFLGKGLSKVEYDRRMQAVSDVLGNLKYRLDTWWE